MEIDEPDYAGPSRLSATSQKRAYLPADDTHPFDLEAYIQNYQGGCNLHEHGHAI